jgi:hypothetical protein
VHPSSDSPSDFRLLFLVGFPFRRRFLFRLPLLLMFGFPCFSSTVAFSSPSLPLAIALSVWLPLISRPPSLSLPLGIALSLWLPFVSRPQTQRFSLADRDSREQLSRDSPSDFRLLLLFGLLLFLVH